MLTSSGEKPISSGLGNLILLPGGLQKKSGHYSFWPPVRAQSKQQNKHGGSNDLTASSPNLREGTFTMKSAIHQSVPFFPDKKRCIHQKLGYKYLSIMWGKSEQISLSACKDQILSTIKCELKTA